MGKIGYGYGSEWQLMRMLGRHREYFDKLVLKSYQKKNNQFIQASVTWFDFKFKGLIDAELLGIDLFNKLNIKCDCNILKKSNWDCIGQIEDIYLLGEAKGHIKELLKEDKSDAGKISKEIYLELVEKIMSIYKIDLSYKEKWLNDSFQLGNRIATQFYLEKRGVDCLLLYILFVEDWRINLYGGSLKESYSVKSKGSWMHAFEKQMQKLGFVSESYKKILSKIIFVFPKCIE